MRDILSHEDEMQNMREHLSRSSNKSIAEAFIGPTYTETVMEPFRRISTESDLQAAQLETEIVMKEFPLLLPNTNFDRDVIQTFWSCHKWMNCIEYALKKEN